jgi:hypothetical protein
LQHRSAADGSIPSPTPSVTGFDRSFDAETNGGTVDQESQ